MFSTLLATKLHRPRPTSRLMARPRLTQRLDEGLRQGHRLFLVVAPAGYGKTTLVTDWLGKAAISSAWISLDEADNDPRRFFAYVAAALRRTFGAKVAGAPPEASPMMPQPPEAFVYPLVNDLAAAGLPILLALDDYHVITGGPVQEAMTLLLEHAPPNLHLVVLTRADPPFPLPRLRVRELMTEIRDHDLRFTPEEMAAFLNSLHRLNLPADQIAALEARTEGWAAGAQLAALSLQGLGPELMASFVSAFSGSHHYIVDYLFEEVLSRQPEEVREFLLQTSILDRMCAPLCDAVLSRREREPGSDEECPPLARHLGSPAQPVLEHLERCNLFLVPLDDERRWYRYHHLLLDVLRQTYRSASPPAQIAALHDRASEWYRQHGFIPDAVQHALLAGSHERAAQVVEENAWEMVKQAELATLEKWIEALPADVVAARPWLRIFHAWALCFRDSEAAETQLRAVEQETQAGDRTAPPAEMQGHITAIRAWISSVRGEPGRAAALARQALEQWPQMDAAVSSGLMAIVGDGRLLENDLLGAARAYAESATLARSAGNIMLEVAAHTSLADVYALMGRLHEAEAGFQEALQRAILHKSPAEAQAYGCLARVHRAWNDLASARRHAEKLIEASALWGVVDARAVGHLLLAVILQAQNDIPGANRALAEANEIIHEHPHEMLSMPWLGAMRARLWLGQGKLAEARRWAETQGLSADGQFQPRNEVEYLTLARILLAEGRADEASRLLARIASAAEAAGRQGTLIEVLVLRAIALHMQAEAGSALSLLGRAVGLARSEDHLRVFLDEGEPIETLLKIAITQWRDAGLLAYARRLLTAFEEARGPISAAQPAQADILSERELEVLRLMAAGRSNREIAAELVIAVGTAKRHTANIFDRLDVRNRTEAVAKARELGLL